MGKAMTAEPNTLERIPYLTEQIIPYIGNKRKLLPLIHEGLRLAFPRGFTGMTFFDPFAGSGIVSRFAKYLGFQVIANDWEYYAYILNYAYLKINRCDLSTMYGAWGGIEGMLSHLNALPDPAEADEYIARYYSPRDDRIADYRRERMFYTRSNGLAIDRLRNEIERLYPRETAEAAPDTPPFREKVLLLALLIHQAGTHTNTSGVFKAYHKGFGGFSGDALSRILQPIALPCPCLWDSDLPQHVFRVDAAELLGKMSREIPHIDVAYLDPPYNQHQYGSNYHMLNTIALWDGVIPGDRASGDKGGIRRDWVKTRSKYCYRDQAPGVFTDLLGALDARHLFISYSTEGIIPFEELIDICADHGRVTMLTNEYVKYRGGRQSIHRLSHNVEFLVIIDRSGKTLAADRSAIDDLVTARKLNLQLKRSYACGRLEESFLLDRKDERIGCTIGGRTLWIRTRGFLRIDEHDLNGLIDRTVEGLKNARLARRELLAKLTYCACRNRVEELQEVMRVVQVVRDDRMFFVALIPDILRKMAHKKYRDIFIRSLREVAALGKICPGIYARIEGKIHDVEALAHRRFSG